MQGANIAQYAFDIAGGSGSTVQFIQPHTAVGRNNAGHGGFAYAGRAVKNHIGDHASVNGAAEHLTGGQEMALAAHFIQSARTQALGKRFLHGGYSFMLPLYIRKYILNFIPSGRHAPTLKILCEQKIMFACRPGMRR